MLSTAKLAVVRVGRPSECGVSLRTDVGRRLSTLSTAAYAAAGKEKKTHHLSGPSGCGIVSR
jgi:hypothetical protein